MVESTSTAINGNNAAAASASSLSSSGSDDNILLISSMDQTRDERFQATLEQLKASTSKAVRPEMIDRVLDGAAILPKSTYQRFVTLLPESTVASSLKSLFPLVTPALDLSAKVEIKSISQDSIAQEVSLVLQGVGYREVRIQDNEVFATAPARTAALPLRRKKDSSAIAAKKAALWTFTDASTSSSTSTPTSNGASTPTIDESSLLTADDLKRATAVQRPDCDVKKTRKACKNCTCGLREIQLQEKDDLPSAITNATPLVNGRAKSGVDRQLPNGDRQSDVRVVTTGAVTSSCGSCYLGDAFRCSSCPYLGLPAFEPGQKVEIPAGMMDDDI
ncbi:DUF689-domain-containing protein [Cystobasidium minutum MCA 4210]|uniref:DUF689-domain-containing protein n=1 Tax=Cystobasidium minutum MCA 4210 TaxID=1397322 RepID=UPI0034CFA97C|eukprot:jgi/Rhomi1/164761/fgenesh1_kg.1_\